ncbi:MAG TPA: septum formation initiator family protein [Candidatus Ornithomonoglobus intestinigallinarum]|uniref:Septum formation initiator family protein n=1 Tax=Candidatus Ornithomonoglobus intestinigallinarum TaxID=2840894 RepID=A0A9D1H524_9FIRM|nr:septum formation initiator family protein [Candidatus Ornithomonoglobus intestinigallinarum]
MNGITNAVMSFAARNKRKIIFWAFAAIVLSMLFKGVMQQPQIFANKQRIAELNEQIEYEKTRQAEIDELSKKVNTDEYIEKIAREKLGLVKSNAKIFIDISSED